MDDVDVVRVLQRVEHSAISMRALISNVSAAPLEDLREVLALQILHDHVDQAIDFAGLVHRHDVGMLQSRAGLRLAIKPIEIVLAD